MPSIPYNWSANTEPQLQAAASPQVLRSGCLQRYMTLVWLVRET